MAQHIGIERLDENGKMLARCEINFADVINKLHTIKDHKTMFPLLSYIDPYGDTYFNTLQKQDLIKELRRFTIENNLTDKTDVIAFIDDTQTHEYIKFIGD